MGPLLLLENPSSLVNAAEEEKKVENKKGKKLNEPTNVCLFVHFHSTIQKQPSFCWLFFFHFIHSSIDVP
jgi:hypothetical protein